jgi:hypothetical protein
LLIGVIVINFSNNFKIQLIFIKNEIQKGSFLDLIEIYIGEKIRYIKNKFH